MTALDAQARHAGGAPEVADAESPAMPIGGRRAAIAGLLIAGALAGAALLVGHGGHTAAVPESRATDNALAIAAALLDPVAQDELDRRTEALLTEGELERRDMLPYASAEPFGMPLRNGADTRITAITRRLAAIQRMQDRASDTQFMKTPVDHALDAIALRAPPLHALQWVLTDPSPTLDTRAQRERFFRMSEPAQARLLLPGPEHTVYARVDKRRFYAMSEPARTAAVKAFYRDAERQFRKQGIHDFVLIVTPYTPTTEHLPALAIGRRGSASLTPLGRTPPNPAAV